MDSIKIDIVNKIYNEYLHRDVDPDGIKSYYKYTNSSNNIEYIKKCLVESEEYKQRNQNSPRRIVTDYINNVESSCSRENNSIINIDENTGQICEKEDVKIDYIESKEDFRRICMNNLPLLRKIIIPEIPKKSDKETFYIEFREFPHSEYLIRNMVIKLPNWAHTIVCGNKNFDAMKKIGESISHNITVIKLDIDNLDVVEYSRLLMTKDFWEHFHGEKLLLYQEDSFLFHNKIEQFLEYDWVGAPWPLNQDEHIDQQTYGVGNGGFSLRTKSKMIECIEKVNWRKDLLLQPMLKTYMKNVHANLIPEDVFFSKSLLENNLGKVAPRNVALEFSQETQKSENPLGGHNFYLANNDHMSGYKKMTIVDRKYFQSVHHCRGWKSVIQHGFINNIYSSSEDTNNVHIIDCCEQFFLWSNKSISKDWFGICHLTHDVPNMLQYIHIHKLLTNINFKQSLKNCKGIIVLSTYMQSYLQQISILHNIPIYSLKHPKPVCENKFNIQKFLCKSEYSLILLGQQLRKLSDIVSIESVLIKEKYWLSGLNDKKRCDFMLNADFQHNNVLIKYDVVKQLYIRDYDEYDDTISTNIIIIPLYNASANNSILEIIESNIPAFVTRLPATEEYLGEDYPMFYSHVNEINDILNDKQLFKQTYIKTHNYLKNMNKSDLTYDKFYSDILKVVNNVY